MMKNLLKSILLAASLTLVTAGTAAAEDGPGAGGGYRTANPEDGPGLGGGYRSNPEDGPGSGGGYGG